MTTFRVFLITAFIGATIFGTVLNSGITTACEQHREREQKATVVAKVVPECDENGAYKAKACTENGKEKFCTCFTKEGRQVKEPSKVVVACDCLIEEYKAYRNPAGYAIFKPECNADGTYAKKQCWHSLKQCWCVNPNGEKITTPTTGQVNCG